MIHLFQLGPMASCWRSCSSISTCCSTPSRASATRSPKDGSTTASTTSRCARQTSTRSRPRLARFLPLAHPRVSSVSRGLGPAPIASEVGDPRTAVDVHDLPRDPARLLTQEVHRRSGDVNGLPTRSIGGMRAFSAFHNASAISGCSQPWGSGVDTDSRRQLRGEVASRVVHTGLGQRVRTVFIGIKLTIDRRNVEDRSTMTTHQPRWRPLAKRFRNIGLTTRLGVCPPLRRHRQRYTPTQRFQMRQHSGLREDSR